MITPSPNTRSIVSHDGAVILDISNNAMTTLNSIGAYIWERLARGLLAEAIITELVRDTGADETRISRDVIEFIEQLNSKHLVRTS
jgi:hypothetical protein